MKHKYSTIWLEQLNLPFIEVNQMALKSKKNKKSAPAPVVAKKGPGRPKNENADSDAAEKKANTKVLMIHISKKLAGRLKIAAQANGDTVSDVIRGLAVDYIKSSKKNIQKFIDDMDSDEDEDVEENEDEDTDTEETEDEEVEEDEDEEEDED
jgi:hypothetical protein